ncbi:MAG: phosphoenolpyruvate--protein phosphotransferase [Deltaproteobacteria bacterium]|jgi:phosphotransferase system enzyme I (PtsI)|nr:phosphoenolpyruvate--protein phosphotransferase [Deltaproteobacteria bacterium]
MLLPPPFVPPETVFRGIGIGTAVVLGEAYVPEVLKCERRVLPDRQAADAEAQRFIEAKARLEADFRTALDDLPPEVDPADREIFNIYLMVLKDPGLLKRTLDYIIDGRLNAEAAAADAFARYRSYVFARLDPSAPYVNNRADEVDEILDALIGQLSGRERFPKAGLPASTVVVVRNLTPAELTALSRQKLAAIVTENGSATSHTALLAQALEIPAVMGIQDIVGRTRSGARIVVDAAEGHVILDPDRDAVGFYEIRSASIAARNREIVRMAHIPARTLDGAEVEVCGNLQLVDEIPAIMSYGGDGVGLYRTEMAYLSSRTLPGEEQLFGSYRRVAEAANPRPVTIRTLDLGADKIPRSLEGAFSSENQALGLRAIRFCLKHPDVFRTQLRAILRASVFGNLRIMIPMVSTLEEVDSARSMLGEVERELRAEGREVAEVIPVGIMVEVPAAVFLARELAARCDFFSIGTNDLIQYSIALDRTNPEVAELYQPLHPSILRMIQAVLDIGRKTGTPVSVCGGMAADPLSSALLVGMGARMLSMPYFDIPRIKRLIRMSFLADLKRLAAEALKASTSGEADGVVRSWLMRKHPDLASA